jgi:hypothetical protein
MGLSTNGRDAVARLVGGDTLSAIGTATGSSSHDLTDSARRSPRRAAARPRWVVSSVTS